MKNMIVISFMLLLSLTNTAEIINNKLKRSDTGSISGIVFNDINNNGIYDFGIDFPQSTGWTVQINGPVNLTTTPSTDGIYSFANLPLGIYTISEIVPPFWTVLSPYWNGLYTVDLSTGGLADNKNFANFNLQRDNSDIEYLRFPNGLNTGNNSLEAGAQNAPQQSFAQLEADLPVNAIQLKVTPSSFTPNTFYAKKNQIVFLGVSNVDISAYSILRIDNVNFQAIAVAMRSGQTKMIAFKVHNVQIGDVIDFYNAQLNYKANGSVGKMIIVGDQLPTITITNPNNVLHSDAVYGNQWYNQNGKINGATNQDYIVTESGEYYCGLTLAGYGLIKSNTITVNNLTTSISKVEKSLNIFPNPTKDYVRISGFIGKVSLILININGEKLFSKEIVSDEYIPLNNLSTGIYIVRIITENDIIEQKIVKC